MAIKELLNNKWKDLAKWGHLEHRENRIRYWISWKNMMNGRQKSNFKKGNGNTEAPIEIKISALLKENAWITIQLLVNLWI